MKTKFRANSETCWRCKECGTLLGVEEGPGLIIRYKKGVEYVVTAGAVTAVCRNCFKANLWQSQETQKSLSE